MRRGKQQITTEPGLQCELSGEPLENIHQVCSESSKFLQEIKKASEGLDVSTISIAFDPYNDLPNIPSMEDVDSWSELSYGDRDMKLLEKVEELTLYIINLQKHF